MSSSSNQAMFLTSTLVLLLLIPTCVQSQVVLTQSKQSIIAAPGGSHKLTCTCSGFNLDSYRMHWIRQAPGKGLEWIVQYYIDSDKGTGQTVQGRFSASKDSSNFYLHMSQLKPEDTAVYYCARQHNYGYFDYWGKGISVTVTSGVQSAPASIFAVSQCGSGSDGFHTLGCLTSGFSPADSLKVKWADPKGTEISDSIQYPAILTNGAYMSLSYVRVKASEWNSEQPFKCTAEHPAGSKTETLKKEVVPEHPASLLLTTPTETELENGTATFVCLASHFSPKTYEFKWKREDLDISAQSTDLILNEGKNNFTAVSILKINANQWMYSPSPIKCEFKQSKWTFAREAKFSVVTDDNVVEIDIKGPSTTDMLLNRGGELQCNANGPKGFKSIKWMSEGKDISSVLASPTSTIVTVIAPISYEDWSNGTRYTCEVEHEVLPTTTTSKTYYRQNGGALQCPSVYLLAPPENSPDDQWATLTCYVKNFYPKEVAVIWLANDKPVEGDNQRTTSVIERGGHFSVYSQLLVQYDDWEQNTVVYSCVVYHEANDQSVRLIARTIDNKSKTPTLVNFSMNVPSGCRGS